MTPEEEASEFHLNVVAVARKRGPEDVKDPRELEQLMWLLDALGEVAVKAAKDGTKPQLVGRAMLYYAKCVAAGTEGGTKGIVPEATDGS